MPTCCVVKFAIAHDHFLKNCEHVYHGGLGVQVIKTQLSIMDTTLCFVDTILRSKAIYIVIQLTKTVSSTKDFAYSYIFPPKIG